MTRSTRTYRYDFRGHHLIPATASNAGGPFSKADTSAAGAPTLVGLNGGGIRLGLEATSEVQNLCLYMGDILPFTIGEIIAARIIAKCTAALDSATSIAFGLGSARNDAVASMTARACFKLAGSQAVVVDTDDGTTERLNVATGLTLGNAWSKFEIRFADANVTRDPPAVSTGRPSNVQFFGNNAYGSLRRVASGTAFDMSAYTAGLQLFAQIQKTADTNADVLDILEFEVDVNVAA